MENNKVYSMYELFGPVCGDGALSLNFLHKELLPTMDYYDRVVLDFDGVKMINDSFSNALFGNLIKIKGMACLDKVKVAKASNTVKSIIVCSFILVLKEYKNENQ